MWIIIIISIVIVTVSHDECSGTKSAIMENTGGHMILNLMELEIWNCLRSDHTAPPLRANEFLHKPAEILATTCATRRVSGTTFCFSDTCTDTLQTSEAR